MSAQESDASSDVMTELDQDRLQVSLSSDRIVAVGGFSDVYIGTATTPSGTVQVAVKLYRYDDEDEYQTRLYEQFMERETAVLRRTWHQSIISLYGTCVVNGRKGLVMPYMAGGTLERHLAHNPNADKTKLLLQVVEGVQYLHEVAKIVHGDIHPRNVLVSDSGDAVLSDFQLSTSISPDATFGSILGSEGMFVTPFAAPEIVLASLDIMTQSTTPQYRTPETDIYSFGMLMWSVLTGNDPWNDMNEMQVCVAVARGERLSRPDQAAFSDELWSLYISCCSRDPALRPSASRVLSELLSIRDRDAVSRSCEEASIPDKKPEERKIDWTAEDEHKDRELHDRRSHPSSPVDGRSFEARPPWAGIPRAGLYKQLLDQRIRCALNGTEVDIDIPKQEAFGAGGMGDLVKGYVHLNESDTVFAVKVCLNAQKTTNRERDIWSTLKHENVLQLCGVFEFTCKDPRSRWDIRCTCFVSPFMQRGNLLEYLRLNGQADRLPLMIDVASGLSYLHDEVELVHGDIKPENVLIADDGRALLADFGLSTTVACGPEQTGYEIRQLLTLAYCAPEIVDDVAEYASAPGVKRSKTKMSDMFSYGILLYETYAGALNRTGLRRFKLIGDLHDGIFPPRPPRSDRLPIFCDELWSMCTRCWEKVPDDRPVIAAVLLELQELRSSQERHLLVSGDFESQLWYLLLLGILCCVHRLFKFVISTSRRFL